MCSARITFSTPKIPRFTWTNTFEDVEDVELKGLSVECRIARDSFEAELAARQNPREDARLENCYTKVNDKAQRIRESGTLSNEDRASLEKADTFLEELKSGNIDPSQTRETRKASAMYKQLLWIISKEAGPACALLLICGVARTIVEKLNSAQSAILVRRMVQCYDSLSSCALEGKAKELGFCTTSVDLSIT